MLIIAILILLLEPLSRIFLKQTTLRVVYYGIFMLGILFFIMIARATASGMISIFHGVVAGVFSGMLSMLLSIFIVNEKQFAHSIEMHGILKEVFVAMMLSMLCGSWLIGGVSFFMLRNAKPTK